MLAVFESCVASGPHELLQNPNNNSSINNNNPGSSAEIMETFSSQFPHSFHLRFKNAVTMAYSPSNAVRPLRSFGATDGILCLFEGQLNNLTTLRQEYGLAKNTTEVSLIINAYMALRDRGPVPPSRVVGDLDGSFAFALFDTRNQSVFVARDSDGTIPWFWGTTLRGSLVFSDTIEILKSSCGKSFAPFPLGCYFTSKMGLQSYEHPSKAMKPVPRVDSSGQPLGALFKVDSKHDGFTMVRVGSEADWTQTI